MKRLFILGIALLAIICEEVPAKNELLDGPMESLSYAEQAQFLDGDIVLTTKYSRRKGRRRAGIKLIFSDQG